MSSPRLPLIRCINSGTRISWAICLARNDNDPHGLMTGWGTVRPWPVMKRKIRSSGQFFRRVRIIGLMVSLFFLSVSILNNEVTDALFSALDEDERHLRTVLWTWPGGISCFEIFTTLDKRERKNKSTVRYTQRIPKRIVFVGYQETGRFTKADSISTIYDT